MEYKIYTKEYREYLEKMHLNVRGKIMDCATENSVKHEKINSVWKKLLLKISNSKELNYVLNGEIDKENLKETIADKLTRISEFKIKKENCLLIRGKNNILKTICMGDTPIPLYSPNILYKYKFEKPINENNILKPIIDTNLEPGYFEYNYEDLLMINSSYVIIQNPDPLTGRFIPNKKIKFIRDSLLQRKSVLIIDITLGQLYPDLVYGKESPSIIDGIIYVVNLSATGLSGDELNFVISNEMVISQINNYIQEHNLCANFLKSSPIILQLLLEGIKSNELNSIFNHWFKAESYSRLQLIEKGIIEKLSYSFPVYLHKIQGGNSLWIYIKDLPLSDAAICKLLRSQGLIANPGSFFYPQKLKKWKHSRECIQIHINGCLGNEMEATDILYNVISKCYKK